MTVKTIKMEFLSILPTIVTNIVTNIFLSMCDAQAVKSICKLLFAHYAQTFYIIITIITTSTYYFDSPTK